MKARFYIYKKTYWPNKEKKPTWGIMQNWQFGNSKRGNTYGLYPTRAIARKILKEIKRLQVVIEHYAVDDNV